MSSVAILMVLLALFFDQINSLTFFFYLTASSIAFYIIFSYKKLRVFLLTLKSYYLFFVALLIVFTLWEVLAQQNLYILAAYKYGFPIAFFTSCLLYGLFEWFLIKTLSKEKLEYLFSSTNTVIPLSMFLLLITKNCSLLYVLLFSRHSHFVTIVILASTLLEVYFGAFAVIGITKSYALSMYKHRNQILNMQYNLQMVHLQHLETYHSEIRRMSHDINNHKTVIYSLIKDKDYDNALEYLERFGTGFSNKNLELLTNNKILNTLLLSKQELCMKYHIPLDLDINIPEHLDLCDFDLCIIVGNLMDNAIEASKKITCTDKASIKVKAAIINNNFIFDMENYYDHFIHLNQGKLLTSKRDTINHGLGLSNVKSTVDKYHGTCQLTFKENVFHSFIRIPLDH